MPEQPLGRSMNMRCLHRLARFDQHTNNHIGDPAWATIALPLALDRPWRSVALSQSGQLLDHVAQAGSISSD